MTQSLLTLGTIPAISVDTPHGPEGGGEIERVRLTGDVHTPLNLHKLAAACDRARGRKGPLSL